MYSLHRDQVKGLDDVNGKDIVIYIVTRFNTLETHFLK